MLLASPRAFCAGVERAVTIVERAVELRGAPVYVRRQIVHNTHVVNDLASRGARFVQDLDQVPAGATVVFAAHGVSPEVRTEAAARGLRVIDATCPMVAKVHNEARLFAEMGFEILLIGQRGHDEIVGTTGEAPEHITLVEGPADVDALVTADSDRLVWLSQTTLSVDETMDTVCSLRQKYPTLTDPPSDDICYATQNRQAAVRLIAPESDLLVVIGSRHSSNSVRLAEVAKLAGAGCVHQVEDATEFDVEWLDGVDTVGLAAGASVPPALVDEVIELLRRNGFPGPIEEPVTVEKMVFPLPDEVLDEPPAV